MILDMAVAVNENHVTKRTPNLKSSSDHEYEDDSVKDAEFQQSIPQDKPKVEQKFEPQFEPKVEPKVVQKVEPKVEESAVPQYLRERFERGKNRAKGAIYLFHLHFFTLVTFHLFTGSTARDSKSFISKTNVLCSQKDTFVAPDAAHLDDMAAAGLGSIQILFDKESTQEMIYDVLVERFPRLLEIFDVDGGVVAVCLSKPGQTSSLKNTGVVIYSREVGMGAQTLQVWQFILIFF